MAVVVVSYDLNVMALAILERIKLLSKLEQEGPVDLGIENDIPQDELFAELASLRKLLRKLTRSFVRKIDKNPYIVFLP